MTGIQVNAITGIITEKLNRNLILSALTAAGKTSDPSDTTQQLSMHLHMAYKSLPNESLARCANCKGVSNIELDVCPYCGSTEGDPLVELPENEKKLEAKMTTEEKVDKKQKSVKKKEKSNGAESVNGGKGGNENGVSALAAMELVNDLKPSSQLHTERELDTAVARVTALKSDAAGSYWALGRAVENIHANQLWKLRMETNEKGKTLPRWKTWEAFCHHELNMSPKSAGKCIDVSTRYSEAQIRAFGPSKLELVLHAPPEERERIMKEKVEKGAGAREVADEVRKAKEKSGYVRATRHAGGKGGKTSAKQTRTTTKIVVAELLGTQTIKAFKRPASLKNVDWKEQARAKKLADEPIGVWNLLNDVVAYISLVPSATGELIFKLQVTREESE